MLHLEGKRRRTRVLGLLTNLDAFSLIFELLPLRHELLFRKQIDITVVALFRLGLTKRMNTACDDIAKVCGKQHTCASIG